MEVNIKVKIEVLQSKHNTTALIVNDYRVAGPKCYGGGTVIHEYFVDADELIRLLEEWKESVSKGACW